MKLIIEPPQEASGSEVTLATTAKKKIYDHILGEADAGGQIVLTEEAPKPVEPGPQPGKRVALVIGNSNYQHNIDLLNPSNDAKAISQEILGELGFDVVSGTDLTKGQMEDVIQRFAKKVEVADAALFFYAGHAIQRDERNHLIPVDANIEDDVAIGLETIELGLVTDLMVSDKRAAIALLDACHDNPLTRSCASLMPRVRHRIGPPGSEQWRRADS